MRELLKDPEGFKYFAKFLYQVFELLKEKQWVNLNNVILWVNGSELTDDGVTGAYRAYSELGRYMASSKRYQYFARSVDEAVCLVAEYAERKKWARKMKTENGCLFWFRAKEDTLNKHLFVEML
jgi:hypothetical protein